MKTGTLEDRYEIYVRSMVELGREFLSFDDWLNNNVEGT